MDRETPAAHCRLSEVWNTVRCRLRRALVLRAWRLAGRSLRSNSVSLDLKRETPAPMMPLSDGLDLAQDVPGCYSGLGRIHEHRIAQVSDCNARPIADIGS